MIRWLEKAKADLVWFLWELALRVVGASLVLLPVVFLAVCVRILWILR